MCGALRDLLAARYASSWPAGHWCPMHRRWEGAIGAVHQQKSHA